MKNDQFRCAEEPLHISGCLRYGDNVEDEWIALSLLFDLTRSFPNTIARAWDCDGEVGFGCTMVHDPS